MPNAPRAIYRQWYLTHEWREARRAQLDKQPFCERCVSRGERVVATVVNHRTPHKGDRRLFIDPSNHESVCKPCHDGLIQREETNGYIIGSGGDGRPLDPEHPWNARRK